MSVNEEKIKEIMKIAKDLKWIRPIGMNVQWSAPSYPLMQLSEVEKCMLAMVDDKYLERMKSWSNES